MEISSYKLFFGFEKEVFPADIRIDEILKTPELKGAKNRFDYTTNLGAVYLITGEIGSGKSTTLRYLLTGLHPSEYKVIYVNLLNNFGKATVFKCYNSTNSN